ncbi:acetyltransferase (GNAT) family protein [Rhizobium leguminosarum bv. trifolii WSM2297]|uniref:Acetyltransferase (GNAT) family protein n=1 Tax=Rhizobium leguminosarum bv. trifolii WSM2297 TaxID=754762 RepID=J0CAX4_RHILT|nr:GNAT family N-acetyltransferase [Rhizobium leguminosarum]EJC80247.1 acetyltransferase (GNAT) family protein [Rhizobium leguminosarum bv. trifolii WSM2297]
MDEEIPDDESFLKVETIFSKHPEAPSVLDFSVVLRRYSADEDVPGPSLAHLKGFIFQPGYLPEDNEDEGYFDVFDERSHHAAIACRILVDDKPFLAKALKKEADLDELDAVAYLERLWVNPSLRGHGIALRLFREAQHVISRPGLLVMVKAHPDEFDRGSNQKLAAYYQSEKQLCFREISKKHEGWLVAAWQDSVINKKDESFFDLDIRETPAVDEID